MNLNITWLAGTRSALQSPSEGWGSEFEGVQSHPARQMAKAFWVSERCGVESRGEF
jgi:hypothetical protein